MSEINNLKGHIIKDGKVVYSEQIENGLHFAIVLMYEPFYSGKNTANHQNSSQLMCEATMTNGNKHTWGNGVMSLDEASMTEIADDNGKFKPLRDELKTKDGFRVWQKDYSYNEYEEEREGKKVKVKTRRVSWLVEVPKQNLLRYCKID
jgi:hypothetical protein